MYQKQLTLFKNNYSLMKDSLGKSKRSSIQWFMKLSHPQKIYLTAFLSLIIFSDSPKLAATIAFAAIIIECLPIVTYVWHTLIGKAVILLSYAIIANFALANAASLVNEVVGVASTQFSYSHNFATLLYVPTWMVGLTIMGLMTIQVILMSYLPLLLILRMLGFTKKWQLSKHPYLISTMFMRMIMTSLVLWVMFDLSVSDFENRKEGNIISVDMRNESSEIASTLNAQKKIEQDEVINDFEISMSKVNVDPDSSSMEKFFTSSISSFFAQRLNQSEIEAEDKNISFASILVAHFVYYFDSDEFSRCELSPKAHGLELNDYEVLQVTPNEQQPLGYDFMVRTCISPAFPESYYQ